MLLTFFIISEIDKSDLSELLPMNYLPTAENATAALAYVAFKSILFGLPDLYNESFAVHPLVTHSIAPHVNDTYNVFNGMVIKKNKILQHTTWFKQKT